MKSLALSIPCPRTFAFFTLGLSTSAPFTFTLITAWCVNFVTRIVKCRITSTVIRFDIQNDDLNAVRFIDGQKKKVLSHRLFHYQY